MAPGRDLPAGSENFKKKLKDAQPRAKRPSPGTARIQASAKLNQLGQQREAVGLKGFAQLTATLPISGPAWVTAV